MLSAIRNNGISTPQKVQQNAGMPNTSVKLQPQLACDTVSFNGYRDAATKLTAELADKASFVLALREITTGKNTSSIGSGAVASLDKLNRAILIQTPEELFRVHASKGREKSYFSFMLKDKEGNYLDPDSMKEKGFIPPQVDSALEEKIQGYLTKVVDLIHHGSFGC